MAVDEHILRDFLSDLLKLEINSRFFNRKEDVEINLLRYLNPGYSTILNFGRVDRTAHAVLVIRDMSNKLFINDIQLNILLPFDEYFRRESNVFIFNIYTSKPLREDAMDIDADIISIIKQKANHRDRLKRAERIATLSARSARSASLQRPQSSNTGKKYSVPNLSRTIRMKKGGKKNKKTRRKKLSKR